MLLPGMFSIHFNHKKMQRNEIFHFSCLPFLSLSLSTNEKHKWQKIRKVEKSEEAFPSLSLFLKTTTTSTRRHVSLICLRCAFEYIFSNLSLYLLLHLLSSCSSSFHFYVICRHSINIWIQTLLNVSFRSSLFSLYYVSRENFSDHRNSLIMMNFFEGW